MTASGRIVRRGHAAALAPAILALLVGALAACGTLPNPLPTQVAPDALQRRAAPPAPPANAPTAAADPTKVGEIQRHRAAWDATRADDYALTLVYGCVCPLAGRQVTVQVEGGRLASATVAGQDLSTDQLTGYPATIDALFDYAERHANAGKIEFAWDRQFGFPSAIGIDPDLQARDDEIRIAVVGFRPGR